MPRRRPLASGNPSHRRLRNPRSSNRSSLTTGGVCRRSRRRPSLLVDPERRISPRRSATITAPKRLRTTPSGGTSRRLRCTTRARQTSPSEHPRSGLTRGMATLSGHMPHRKRRGRGRRHPGGDRRAGRTRRGTARGQRAPRRRREAGWCRGEIVRRLPGPGEWRRLRLSAMPRAVCRSAVSSGIALPRCVVLLPDRGAHRVVAAVHVDEFAGRRRPPVRE